MNETNKKSNAVLQEPFSEIGPKLHLLLHTGQLLMETERTVTAQSAI